MPIWKRKTGRSAAPALGPAPPSSQSILIGLGAEKRHDGELRRYRLTYKGDASLLTVGPAGSGKGVYSIIPNLLMYAGSVVCIDPKGENASITARYRRDVLGQKVVVLDPWEITENGVAPECRGSFNPLAGCATAEQKVDRAEIVTDALVMASTDSGSSHWDEEARAVIRGLILHCLTSEALENQHLLTVRRYMTGGDPAGGDPVPFLEFVATQMAKNPALDGMVQTAAMELLGKPRDEQGSVISNAQKNMRILDNPRIRRVIGFQGESFHLWELKQRPTTVYVCLPNDQIHPMARWFRLLVNSTINGLMATKRGPQNVLVICDEFAALGHLNMMERAVAEARGYGVRIWPIVQDLNQLKKIYGDNWQTFVANSGAFQVLAVNDHWTAEQISKRMGTTTTWVTSHSTGESTAGPSGSTSSGTSTSKQSVPLMRPEELMTMGEGIGVFMPRGVQPIACNWISYLNDRAMAGRWDPNPYHSQVAGQPSRPGQRFQPGTLGGGNFDVDAS